MSRAPVLRSLLSLALMLLTLLSIVSWLHDGHVTPEQALWHALSVAQRGGHVHTSNETDHHHAPTEHGPAAAPPIAEAGELLLTSPALTSFLGFWQTIAPSVLALLVLGYRGPAEPPPRQLRHTHHPSVMVPPPR